MRGDATIAGGRLLRVLDYVSDGPFCFTDGDGVSYVVITDLITHHRNYGCKATILAVNHPGRYCALKFGVSDSIHCFQEKP